MRQRLNALTIIGMIMVLTGLGHLLTAFLAGPEDRWTPRQLAIRPQEAADRVRVLVSGTPLADHLAAGTLKVAAEVETARPVTPDEVRLRFNNWDRARADLYYRAIFSASYTTAGAAALLAGLLLMPRLTPKSAPDPSAG
ncbi:MAG: hypothetical protein U9R68_00545 [Planctomycetota bacterium]|nr:hypothetical protein [Planctomycetota bacterium]